MKKSLVAAGIALASGLAAMPALAAQYTIDPTHTFVTFEIDHNGTSTNRGRFDKVEGTIEFDRAAKTGKADISVQIASVNTGTAGFDKHLQTGEIFNVEKFPTARFVSDKFEFDDGKVEAVHGQLTLLGKTLPVKLEAEKFNCYENRMLQGREVCGGDFELKIDRTQWGSDYGVQWGAAKDVKILIQIEAVKQD
ncbi:Polyisoprenoid-binding protein YceI [Lampropedia hyalina DSM 16112]|jgi:polyisoprenoid-binding protein YceI|uniref:Polyisoprenoid-binding protein YceI n=1 Tax=Lampropedia hyalina DSM 16112 TaxID=1122156 RepID=A0A1M4SKS5_9BURK|nr:YceI family protein [Lampropedia hyalina]SHE32762.1 Polyisoprenoid-binding protein YceI [Lampropedia hyalina DSM 16112]